MKLLFFGSGPFGVPTLEALAQARTGTPPGPYELVTVVSQPDRPAGRGKKATPTPVRAWCEQHGLPVMPVEQVNDHQVVEDLLQTGAHLGVVVAFGQKIGPQLLEALPGGCINLHASLLPKYRGAAPIQRAVLEGETRTGVTVFRLIQRMDAGPILATAETAIAETETAGELHDRLARLGPDVVLRVLSMFAGGTVPAGRPQDETRATRAPKLTKAEGVIHWNRAAPRVIRLIHGMCPWPGATTTFASNRTGRSEPVTILRARPGRADSTGPPGSLTEDLQVRCGHGGALSILEIKPANSRAMTWRDFVNGRHVTSTDRFG